MRRLIGIILLICAFAGGYHLGRQKDSPDLIGYAQQAVVTVAAVAGDIAASFSDDNPDQAHAATGEYRANARATGDSRAYTDTRAYVNESYARESSRYVPTEPQRQDAPAQAGTEVAQAGGKTDTDWASRLWKSLQTRPEGK